VGTGLAAGWGVGATKGAAWATGAGLAACIGACGRAVAATTGGAAAVGRVATIGAAFDPFAAMGVGSGGGGGIEGSTFSRAVSVGTGAAAALSGLPDASHMTPPMSATAPAATPTQSPVLGFTPMDARDGWVAEAGRGGRAVIRCVDGTVPAAAAAGRIGGMLEGGGGVAEDAAHGPGEATAFGRSGAERALAGGATSAGSTMTLFTGSSTADLVGTWLPCAAVSAIAALTSACVPPPCKARMSPADRDPAPVNGASSSCQDGRNAVASRSRSSGVSGAFSKGAGPLGGFPG
jgi:hypothetical protein